MQYIVHAMFCACNVLCMQCFVHAILLCMHAIYIMCICIIIPGCHCMYTHKAYTSASEILICMFSLQDMLLKLQAILLVTGFIGALGQIIQIPDTPTKTIGGFSQSHTIAIDEEERRVYVSDRDVGNAVRVFNGNGGLILTITAGFIYPGGIAISTTDRLYIADEGNDRIVITTKDGSLQSTIGTSGSGEGQLDGPHDVVIGPDGLLYVADAYNNRVQVLTLDGQFVKKLDLEGSPFNVAFGTDGRLHVGVFEISRIVIFDANGIEVQSVDLEYAPVHMDIDCSGYIYVTTNADLKIYDEYYNLLRTISGFENQRFNGIARWEGKNEIWTSDYGDNVYVYSGP